MAFAAGVLVAIVLQRGPLRRGWVVAVPVVSVRRLVLDLRSPLGDPERLSPFTTSRPARRTCSTGSRAASPHCSGLEHPELSRRTQAALALGAPAAGRGDRGATVWMLRSRTDLRALVLVPLAVGLTFWLLTAANFHAGAPPHGLSLPVLGAVFVLMIAGELAAGWRPGWRGSRWRSRSDRSGARQPRDPAPRLSHLDGRLGDRARRARRARDRRGPRQPRLRSHSPELELQLLHVRSGQARTSQRRRSSAPRRIPRVSWRAPRNSPGGRRQGARRGPADQSAANRGPARAGRARAAPARAGGGPRGSAPGVSPCDRPPPRRPSSVSRRAGPSSGRRRASPRSCVSDVSHRRPFRSRPARCGIGELAIPSDHSSRPWQLQILAPGRVTVCGRAAA